MTEELHKRLDDAAKRLENRGWRDIESAITRSAELGYKEAIEVAKEWLLNNVKNYLGTLYADAVFGNGLLADFETDMNKFWEENK